MTLAIFDLDNTLLDGDSDHAWGEFLVNKNLVDKASYQQSNDYFFEQYKQGCLDIEEFLAFSLKPLSQHSKQALDDLHKEFMETHIKPMWQPKAEKLLAEHKSKGHFLLIITATNYFVTAPIAKALQVDDIIATEPEIIDGQYTGKFTGTACFQEGKITRLNEWLIKHPEHNLKGSYFYSDSRNDLPLLEIVDHPIAVNADEHLTAHAQQAGWPILNLRNQ